MKKILSLVLTLAMLATMCVFGGTTISAAGTQWNGEAATAFSGGNGTAVKPYQIGTAAELKLFANIVNGSELNGTGFTRNNGAWATLTADIVLNVGDVSGCNGVKADGWVDWLPIGYACYNGGSFVSCDYTGSFNGAGHTVSGVYFNNEEHWYAGLFGQISSGAEISNLGVVNSYFRATDAVGGVCGFNSESTITGCYNSGTVNGDCGGNDYCTVGGVCGNIEGGTIKDCYNTGAVSGNNNIGGVCGNMNNDGTIKDCYNTGSVEGNKNIGGVCGNVLGAVTGCYNAGAVEGTENVGGVCGMLNGGHTAPTITDCFNIGSVSGDSDVGGVCGEKFITGSHSGFYAGIITNCFYLQGTATAGIGNLQPGSAEAKTEAQMKTPEFVDLLNANGGNFTYHIGYPSQSWQPDPNIYGTAVTYNVAPVYIVTIPAEVTLGGTATVSAENVVLDEGKQLEIALTGTSGDGNAFTVSNGKTTNLTYQVTDNSTSNIVAVGGTVLTVNPADGASGDTTLNFSNPTNTVIYSGKYTGTVTFTVSVKKVIINITLAPDVSSQETVTLTAEQGMTWREWLASEYNTDNWVYNSSPYDSIFTDTNFDANTKGLCIATEFVNGEWNVSVEPDVDDIISPATIYVLMGLEG